MENRGKRLRDAKEHVAYRSFGTVIDTNRDTVRKIYKEDLSAKVFLSSLGEVSTDAMEATPLPLGQTLLLLQNPKSPAAVNNLLKELEGERALQSSLAQSLIHLENRMSSIEEKNKELEEKNKDLEEKLNPIYGSYFLTGREVTSFNLILNVLQPLNDILFQVANEAFEAPSYESIYEAGERRRDRDLFFQDYSFQGGVSFFKLVTDYEASGKHYTILKKTEVTFLMQRFGLSKSTAKMNSRQLVRVPIRCFANVKNDRDFSCHLFDRTGNLAAEAQIQVLMDIENAVSKEWFAGSKIEPLVPLLALEAKHKKNTLKLSYGL